MNISQDIPIILQNEVYKSIGDRRNIKGYKKLSQYDDERTAVYKQKNYGKKIQVGLRGTSLTSPTDFLNDAELALDAGLPFLPEQVHIKKRLDKDEDLYKKLRKQYPDRKLVFSGHSLGAVSVKNILDKHPDDKNLEGHLFNHWIFDNQDKKVKDDKRLFNNDSEDLLKSPIEAGLAGSGTIAGAAGIYYRRRMKQQMASGLYRDVHAQAEGRGIPELDRVFSGRLADAPSPRPGSFYQNPVPTSREAVSDVVPRLSRQNSGTLSDEINDLDLDLDFLDDLPDAAFGGRAFNPFVIEEGLEQQIATPEEHDAFGESVNNLAETDAALEEAVLEQFRLNAARGGYGAGAAGLAYFLYKIKKYHSSNNFQPKDKNLLIKN